MITDAEVMEILNEVDSGGNRPNQERVEFERLLDYVTTHVMGYPRGSTLSESFINAVRNAVASLKLQKDGFSCVDFMYLLKSCKDKIEYCNKTITYQSELHKLNTALKVAKNRYIDSIVELKQRESALANMKGFVIPLCENNAAVKERFGRECNFDEEKSSLIISSLVSAWLDGKVRIMGI